MLVYLGLGQRRYDRAGVVTRPRGAWEWQAILSGACYPTLKTPVEPMPASPSLWIFHPGCPHGWSAPAGDVSEVAVGHFDHVPEPIRRWVPEGGCVNVPLTGDQAEQVRELMRGLVEDFQRPTAVSVVRFDRAVLELAEIALTAPGAPPAEPLAGQADRRVRAALTWYDENLAAAPTVGAVAEAVGLSETHLRRMFDQAGYASPLTEMKKIQMDRVKQLLVGTDWPLSRVAEMCGFSADSELSRAFRRVIGQPPGRWRRRHRSRQVREG